MIVKTSENFHLSHRVDENQYPEKSLKFVYAKVINSQSGLRHLPEQGIFFSVGIMGQATSLEQ